MQQIIRKGIKDIQVEEVPDPIAGPHHVLIRPVFSLISSGTETASIHQEGVLKEVADNPSHIKKVLDVMKTNGVFPTIREVNAKFSEYAALGYSGAGIVVEKHRSVTDLELGDRVAYGGEGTGHAETIVTGRNLVARVPIAVQLDHACFATLGSIALNAVRIANISLGDRVVVIGLGLVGQLVSQLARLARRRRHRHRPSYRPGSTRQRSRRARTHLRRRTQGTSSRHHRWQRRRLRHHRRRRQVVHSL